MCEDVAVTAKYDGKTQFGQWAYMCPSCFGKYGIGLGLGKGQRLNYVNEEKNKE